MTENKNTYDENQIQVLEGLEAVRKRPGMYIGSTSVKGLHHLVYEIVDNSIDEALAGACTKIVVTLHKDGSCSVRDNGRGIPNAVNHKTGTPSPEVVFTILHAGGKFGGEGYAISGGLHGVGASVVNALSEWLIYENTRGGRTYTQSFERGAVKQPFTLIHEDDRPSGLYVRFMPDSEIFEETVFDYEVLLDRLREQAFLNAGVRIVFIDDRGSEPVENDLCYEGGIKSFVSHLNEAKHAELIHPAVIYMSATKGTNTAEVAIQYNDSYNETIMSFANNIHTVEGGTHEVGFKTALTRVLNDYGKRLGVLKDSDKPLSGEDCREGICAVISVKLHEPQFEGQTKTKLGNSEMRSFVDSVVNEKLSEFFE